MTDRLVDWWRRRRWTTARYPGVTYFSSRSEVPELPPRRTIAVVGSAERPKWAIFACPCGHGHAIAVNLSPARRPSWRLKAGEEGPSLRPSVDSLTDERRCHFWLREGRIQWARDDVRSQEILPPGPIRHQEGGARHGT